MLVWNFLEYIEVIDEKLIVGEQYLKLGDFRMDDIS